MRADAIVTHDDKHLIRLIVETDEAALGELYERYHRLVYSVAFKTVGDHSLAEEITQDVYLRIWRNASQFDPEQGKVAPWIAGITRNRSIDLLRRRDIRPDGHLAAWSDGHDNTFISPERDIEDIVELVQRRKRIQEAIAELPERQRAALSLAFFYGYSHSEIANILDTPLGTVKTRIRLAMQTLRQDYS